MGESMIGGKTRRHPREAEGEKTRQEILRVGLELFARQGYSDTTITQIAEGARTYRSSVDWHFGGKEGLLLAVAEYYLEKKLGEDIQQGWELYSAEHPQAGAKEIMEFFFQGIGQTLEGRLPIIIALFSLTFEQIHKNPSLAEKIRNFWTNLTLTLAEVIRLGQEKKWFRATLDPDWTAKSILALCQGLFMQWYMEPGKLTAEEALRHITLATMRLLYQEPPGSLAENP